MLPRKIRANHLRPHIRGGKIHVYAFPAAFPFRVGQETTQHFRIQVAFAFEIAIKTAVRQTGPGHNLLNRYIFEAVAIEKLSRALHDILSYFCAVSGWIGHEFLAYERVSMA